MYPFFWSVNPLPAKLSNLNFHPLEIMFRYCDPQLQVGENTYICLIRNRTLANLDVKTRILLQITVIIMCSYEMD